LESGQHRVSRSLRAALLVERAYKKVDDRRLPLQPPPLSAPARFFGRLRCHDLVVIGEKEPALLLRAADQHGDVGVKRRRRGVEGRAGQIAPIDYQGRKSLAVEHVKGRGPTAR